MAVAKRMKAWKSKLTPGKQYPVEEALKLVKEFATAKFNESIDASVNLGIDASKSDQQVRGSTVMPNPKVGTVTQDVATAVKNAKAGQVTYRVDKAGIVHATIGKASFEVKALKENLTALINDLQKAKPSAAKGQYMKRVAISSTMGPGVVVEQGSIGAGGTTASDS